MCSVEASPSTDEDMRILPANERPLDILRHACFPAQFCYQCGPGTGKECPPDFDMVEGVPHTDG